MTAKKQLGITLLIFTLLFSGCTKKEPIVDEASQTRIESNVEIDEAIEKEKEEVFEEDHEHEEDLAPIVLNFIQQPEELIVSHKEDINRFNELSQSLHKTMNEEISNSEDDIPAEAKEIVAQMEKEIESRKKIHNSDLIKSIFDEIITLKAHKHEIHDMNIHDNILFVFDLVDNKDLGLAGNSKEGYIRYLAVLENNLVVIPIVEKHAGHDHFYYATAEITEEFFNKLKEVASK